jgi:hypothetical protein
MSSSGDPYVLLNAMSYFHIWEDEIDELWIGLNTTMSRDFVLYLLHNLPGTFQWSSKIKILYINKQIGFGKPLELLLDLSPHGNVLLLEDDTIIFKKGVVNAYFSMLEEDRCDLIGSPRMSCSPETARELQVEFSLNYEGRGDKGPMFWPCFLWVKKELLQRTDKDFDPSDWGDTFAWMSVQLRRLTTKILDIPQYHCSPDDDHNKEHGWGIFDGVCGYMHLGSLSSGIQSYLLTEDQVPLADLDTETRAEHPQPIPNSREMQNRLMWWHHCFMQRIGDEYTYEAGLYESALMRVARIMNADNTEDPFYKRNLKMYLDVINESLQ